MKFKQNRLGVLSLIAFAVLMTAMVGVTFAEGSGSKKNEPTKDQAEKQVRVAAELNAQALMAIKNAKVPMALLDARGASAQWIDGATPLEHDADEKAVRKALANRDQLIVTYCGGPECPMSQMLADHLAKLGYTNVIRFTGGLMAWEEAGYELKTEKKAPGSGSKPQQPGSGTKPSKPGSGSK